jgi:hypothetical protein
LFEKIVSFDNLVLAHKNARKGKTRYKEVIYVDNNLESCINEIQGLLVEETYKVSNYKVFNKKENGKVRKIASLPYYPDRIIQWAIIQVIGEIFDKHLIYDTYSSIKGKGIHFGFRRLKMLLHKQKDKQYCLKLDISKYYQSVDKQILKNMLERKFKDKKLLNLLFKIIDSNENGIPIGNFLSQHFANFYLSGLDRYIKEIKKAKLYFRYMDDIVIFHKNKRVLHFLQREIAWYCREKLRLKLKKSYQIFPVEVRGVDFLGYVFRKEFVLIRKKIKINMIKKTSKNKEKSAASYFGWLKWCDCTNLMCKYKLI